MITAKVHRSAGGHKICLPKNIMHALALTTGQIVVFHHAARGVVEIRNASLPIELPADPHPERANPLLPITATPPAHQTG